MKKHIKIIVLLFLALLMCVAMVSCGGKEEVKPCETHVDDDNNLVCDVCNATLTPEGPSQAEIEKTEKEAIVQEWNTFLASGVSLIKNERKLGPVTTKNMSVETNLPDSHWISRLKKLSANDKYIYMTLETDNKLSKQETKDVVVGIMPMGIYSIEDDTIALDYDFHLYTSEQMRVITSEIDASKLKYNSEGQYYTIDSAYLIETLVTIFNSKTALAINQDLYTRQQINTIKETLMVESKVTLNDSDKISSCTIKYYTKDNGLVTDIGTISYEYEPAKTVFHMSFQLNYIMDFSYTKESTGTYQEFKYGINYNTSNPSDRTFKGKEISVRGVLTVDPVDVVVPSNDIANKITDVENSLFHSKTIMNKYSDTYSCVGTDWVCDNVYVYDERYDIYVLLSREENGRQMIFNTLAFDVDFANACFGELDLKTRRITIIQHSDKELLHAKLKEQYGSADWTATTTECLSVAVYDADTRQYIFFKRTRVEDGYVYKFSDISGSIDKTTTCIAEANVDKHTLRFTEHNTDHTSH